MKALGTLIRLHRQRLDEKRIRLVELEIEREALNARVVRLAVELESEGRAAAASYEAGRAFPSYAERVAAERRSLADQIATLDAEIVELGEAVFAAYRELKKYEVGRDLREHREKSAEARREQGRLDEVGLTAHRRKQAR